VQACCAVWSYTRDQRSKVCGGRESEKGEIQVYEGEEVGFVLFGTTFVFFEVAVVEAWVWGVEGWLCCIGDWFLQLVRCDLFGVDSQRGRLTSLIDQFAGLNDIFLKCKTQSIRDLRF
jgi:hypothetical protein